MSFFRKEIARTCKTIPSACFDIIKDCVTKNCSTILQPYRLYHELVFIQMIRPVSLVILMVVRWKQRRKKSDNRDWKSRHREEIRAVWRVNKILDDDAGNHRLFLVLTKSQCHFPLTMTHNFHLSLTVTNALLCLNITKPRWQSWKWGRFQESETDGVVLREFTQLSGAKIKDMLMLNCEFGCIRTWYRGVVFAVQVI